MIYISCYILLSFSISVVFWEMLYKVLLIDHVHFLFFSCGTFCRSVRVRYVLGGNWLSVRPSVGELRARLSRVILLGHRQFRLLAGRSIGHLHWRNHLQSTQRIRYGGLVRAIHAAGRVRVLREEWMECGKRLEYVGRVDGRLSVQWWWRWICSGAERKILTGLWQKWVNGMYSMRLIVKLVSRLLVTRNGTCHILLHCGDGFLMMLIIFSINTGNEFFKIAT